MIKTERLEIRLIELKDLENLRKSHNHSETLKWLSDTHVISQNEQILWFQKLQSLNTARPYVVELLESKELVGVFRLGNIDIENKSTYAGLDIAVDYRRRGFALETYSAMNPYLFDKFKLYRLSLTTLANNYVAISLYKKLGDRKAGVIREAFYKVDKFIDGFFYSMLRPDRKG
jgi:RimJ/RimL family protein N-acetyltransferase